MALSNLDIILLNRYYNIEDSPYLEYQSYDMEKSIYTYKLCKNKAYYVREIYDGQYNNGKIPAVPIYYPIKGFDPEGCRCFYVGDTLKTKDLQTFEITQILAHGNDILVKMVETKQ